MSALALSMTLSLLAAEPSPPPAPAAPTAQVRRPYCVLPAAGGAVVGVAVAWYGFLGLSAAAGRSAWNLESTPGNVALVLGVEWLGLSAGAAGACALWGQEGRWLPTAVPVVTGAMLGGVGAFALAMDLITRAQVDANTDFPLTSALGLLGGTLVGVTLGGLAGFGLDFVARGEPMGPAVKVSAAPMVAPGVVGLAVGGTF